MLNTRTVSIFLAAVIAVAGILLFLQAEEVLQASLMTITVDHVSVRPPATIHGIAGVLPETTVEVFASIDDMPIPGSPDETMEGDVNRFSFDVTEEMRGKSIRIVAIGADGSVGMKIVHVN